MRLGGMAIDKLLGTNVKTRMVSAEVLAEIMDKVFILPAVSEADLEMLERTLKGKWFWPSGQYSDEGRYWLYVSPFKRGLITHRTVWVKNCETEEVFEWKGYTLGPIKNAVAEKLKKKRMQGFQKVNRNITEEGNRNMEDSRLKKCPYCAELIKSTERVCPICSSALPVEMQESKIHMGQVEKTVTADKTNQNEIKIRVKTLSSDAQKEYIHYFIKIKEWMAIGMMIIGALLGLFVGNTLEFGIMGILICLFLGWVIGAIVGLNQVGSALMQAITAEQGVITEELLTEILNELESEE